MTDLIHKASERGMNWVNSCHDACQWCGHTWHKHELWCPNYSSIAPKRCRVAHTPFLRGSNPKAACSLETQEYECSLCNVPPVYTVELPTRIHPMCLDTKPRHYWGACGDGCCPPYCTGCGVTGTWADLKKQYEEEQ